VSLNLLNLLPDSAELMVALRDVTKRDRPNELLAGVMRDMNNY